MSTFETPLHTFRTINTGMRVALYALVRYAGGKGTAMSINISINMMGYKYFYTYQRNC